MCAERTNDKRGWGRERVRLSVGLPFWSIEDEAANQRLLSTGARGQSIDSCDRPTPARSRDGSQQQQTHTQNLCRLMTWHRCEICDPAARQHAAISPTTLPFPAILDPFRAPSAAGRAIGCPMALQAAQRRATAAFPFPPKAHDQRSTALSAPPLPLERTPCRIAHPNATKQLYRPCVMALARYTRRTARPGAPRSTRKRQARTRMEISLSAPRAGWCSRKAVAVSASPGCSPGELLSLTAVSAL